MGHHGPDQPRHLLHRLALGPEGHSEPGYLGRRGLAGQDLAEEGFGLHGRQRLAGDEPGQCARPTADGLEGRCGGTRGSGFGMCRHRAQSHHRSRPSTPRAIRPSCTCEVPSTMVSCLASRYQSSAG